MKFIRLGILFLFGFLSLPTAQAQTQEIHLSKIELKKKGKKIFQDHARDSNLVLFVDTLIMKDRSSLQFYGLKDVRLIVKHAEIGKNAFFSGIGSENNASNLDIQIHFVRLGSLYVIARGQDAMNGTKTYPNGNGGTVEFSYTGSGLEPQSKDKKDPQYLHIDVSGGGHANHPTSDLNRIYDQIRISGNGLRGIPQGQIYSGSPGIDGKVTIRKQ